MNKIVDLIYYKCLMEPCVEQDHPHDLEAKRVFLMLMERGLWMTTYLQL